MRDNDGARRDTVFDFKRAASILSGGVHDGLNACFECCDRHAAVNPDGPAIYHEDAGSSTVFTFADLQLRSTGFAHLLTRLGVGPGDCVAALVPRSAELVAVALGVWRIGAIFMPLFTAFGEAAISHRLSQAGATLLVIDDAYRHRVEGIENPPGLVTVSAQGCKGKVAETWAKMHAAAPVADPIALNVQSPFLRMFTSGTSGKAKSLDVPLKALIAFGTYMREGVDLKHSDKFWNLADPGWAYGLYYGLIGPLLLGIPTLFNKQAFDPQAAIEIIRRRGITSLAGSPTAFRLLMAAGPDAVRTIKDQLMVVSSAGEPLTVEIHRWFCEHLGVSIRDHYGQTELGIVLAGHERCGASVVRAAGAVPMPGFRLVIVDEAGGEVEPGGEGELAVDSAASPLFWFEGYRETKPSNDRFYRTGDAAQRTSEGRFSFIGRADDVITSSGYRIGPFDVESVLLEHGDIFEVAVVGKADPKRTEIVKAFIVLRPGATASNELAENLMKLVRHRLSAHAYPREIEFVDSLPKTPSGKIQRHLLKER